MMKKTVTLILALSLAAGVMSGCGKKTAQVDENGRYTYTMTMYQTSTNNPDAAQLKAIENKYNMNLDVWDVEWQKYDEILNLKLAGGEVPDIIYVKSAEAAQKYVDQDVVAPIPLETLQEKAPNVLKRLEEDAPDILKYYYINDELYALPSFSVGSGAYGIPMVWRGDWLKNVGINKVPETLDEYEDAFYKFTNNDPDGNGKKDTYGLSRSGMLAVFAAYGYVPTMGQTGTPQGYWMERDGKLVYSSVQPEMKEALARLSKWYKDGVVDPEFITGENKGGYWAISHQFVNGIIGFTTHGMSYHWEPKAFVDSDESTSGQDRYELEKLDAKAAESLEVSGIPPYISKETQKTYPKREYVRGERWMFSKELVEDEEKFNKLLEIYNDIYASKDNFDYANSGERGVVWEYEDAVSTNGKTYKRAVNLGDWKNEEYRKKNKFSFNLFTPSFPDSEKIVTPRDDWAVPRGFDKLYMPNNRLYVSLPSENTYSAELDKIEEETYIDIITGAKPVDYFDEFVEKWRSSGGAKLEEEAEAWYREVNE